jgi:hypothetical protein
MSPRDPPRTVIALDMQPAPRRLARHPRKSARWLQGNPERGAAMRTALLAVLEVRGRRSSTADGESRYSIDSPREVSPSPLCRLERPAEATGRASAAVFHEAPGPLASRSAARAEARRAAKRQQQRGRTIGPPAGVRSIEDPSGRPRRHGDDDARLRADGRRPAAPMDEVHGVGPGGHVLLLSWCGSPHGGATPRASGAACHALSGRPSGSCGR